MKELMFLAVNCVTDCGGADILRILKFVFILIDLACFLVPIGLIIMIMLDFSKNVIAGKEDEMKKNVSIVIKRLIYCVVIFLVPTIVNFAVKLVSDTGDNIAARASYCIDYAKNGDLSKCKIDYDTLEPTDRNKCYFCVEEVLNKKEFSYVWSSRIIENNSFENKECTSVNGILTKDECLDKNNTIEYCYYCDATENYYYGVEPQEICSSSWEKDFYKDKENCKTDNEEGQNREYCYVCSLGNNSEYRWSSVKPNDVCMSVDGWKIDYSITLRAGCIYKP